MKSTRVTVAVAAALTLVGLAACAPATTGSAPQTTISIEAQPSIPALPDAPEDPRPAVIWPLTGLDAAGVGEAELSRPALAIKIENSKDARPQENLDKADVVFEEYVEAGISRLVAVFHSQYPESVGPIRSMRPMDKNIMGSLGGPLVFSGAQARFIHDAQAHGITLITQDLGASGFYRQGPKKAPHNLHGSPQAFADQAAGMPAPTEQWAWAYPVETASAAAGSDASHIDIRMSGYSHPSWSWDAGAGRWMRSEDGAPHVTLAGTQISATSVVMLWVDVRFTDENGGASVPETLLAGESGAGWVAAGGKAIPVTWSKGSQGEPIALTTQAGEPVALAPGQTWFELIPNADTVGHATSITIS